MCSGRQLFSSHRLPVSINHLFFQRELTFLSYTVRSILSTSANSSLPSTESLYSAPTTPTPHMANHNSSGGAGLTFELQLRAIVGSNFTQQHFKDAVFLKDKPLFQNYKNWLSMARLLDPEVINLPGLSAGEVTTTAFSANEAAEILRYFNWAPTSYYKKRRLFLWAYSAAHMLWSGATESKYLYLIVFI